MKLFRRDNFLPLLAAFVFVLIALCFVLPARAAVTYTVTEPTWLLSTQVGGTHASYAECIGAAKSKPAGVYLCTTPAVTVTAAGTVTQPPPPPPPPTGGVGPVVYQNGVFKWLGDFSWNVTLSYKDTTGIVAGDPVTGPTDISVNVFAANGGWQPFAFNAGGVAFDASKYTFFHFCAKPTRADQIFGVGFASNLDGPTSNIQFALGGHFGFTGPITKVVYGPPLAVGQYTCYDIPLAEFALFNTQLLKLAIADGGTGTGQVVLPNLFYLDDVYFH